MYSFSVKAQIKLWDKTYGGNREDRITTAIQTSDGGYLLGGWSVSGLGGDKTQPSKGDWDYWVIKLNADGSKAWDKSFGGKNGDFLNSVQQTKDGGYILGGESQSGKSGDKSEAPTGAWMVKLKADGSKAWDKTIPGGGISFIRQLSDGGYVLAGIFNSATKRGEYWVAKVNPDGSKVWDKAYGGMDRDILTALVVAPDGGYLLGGFSTSDKGGDKSESRKSECTNSDGEACYDYWVVKINGIGTKQWDKTFGGYDNDRITTIATTSDGGYLLGGVSASDKGMDRSDPTRDDKEDENTGDFWLIKIQANGTKVWDKAYGGNKTDELATLVGTQDGGYLLSGYSGSDSGGEMGIRRGIGSNWVLKIDAKGNKIWDTNVESGPFLVPTSDGNCLLAGTKFIGFLNSFYNTDFWLVKLQIPNKKVQTITFYPPDQGLANSPYTLSAKTNSGLPVTFKLISGPAIQKNNQLRFTAYGTVVVKAFQAGNDSYSAVEYTTSFQVVRFPKQQDKTIGGDKADMLADMVAIPDGGYLLAGTSSSGISGDKSLASKGESDYWLVKLDKDKKKVWDKSYGGKGTETISTIIPTSDGAYLLGGSSASGREGDKSSTSKGKLDYWLVKVDASGNKLWDKSFGGNQDDNLKTIIATPDGGYLLSGSSNSNKSGDKSEPSRGNIDYWIVKIDGHGNKLWDKTFGGNNTDNLASIIATDNDGYLLGGSSDSDKSGDKTEANKGFEDYWVVKINTQGKKLWDKTYDHGYVIDKLTAMLPTPDGGALIAGVSGFESPFNYWVLKLDSKGTIIWEKEYGGAVVFTCYFCENNRSIPIEILPTPTGHYLLAGYSYSTQGRDRSEKNRGREDYWVLEIDENGLRIGDKSFGGDNPDYLVAMIPTDNGGYLLGGYSNSPASHEKSENSKGDNDFWLVETQISTFPPTTLEAWNLLYGGNNLDNLTTVLPTNDGGYLLGGYSYSKQSGDKSQNGYGKSDYWVIKTDAAGKKLWDKRYGGTGADYLKSIVPTYNGGFLLGGSSESTNNGNKTAANKGKRDIWIVKINSIGEKEWEQSYGSSGLEDLQKIISLPDGTFLLAGYSDSPVGGDKTQANKGGLDYWLIKINDNGGFKYWDKTYGGNANDYPGDVLVLNNGDLLVGGTSFSSATGDKSQSNRGGSDYWLLKTNSEGKKLWDKRYGGANQDQLLALLSLKENTILLGGNSASGVSGDKSQASQGGKDFWLVQVDGKGEKQWDKTYGGSEDETLRSLLLDKDGGYIFGGTSFSGKSGDKSQESQGSSDYWLVKTNNKGEKLWDKRYGGSQQEELRAMWITDDGGYLLGGRSNSDVSGDRTQPSQGENDFWLVKVAPVTTQTIVSKKITASESEVSSILQPGTAYPNPFVQEVNISFKLPQTQKATVKVYNSQGQEVATLFKGEVQAAQTYTCKWKAGTKAAGIYIVQLHTPNKIHTIKLLKTQE
ncbi:T9SS type A sorting domain-containing protein [Adhaeribacter radiodurans]|uniref:T9SS type A sorting domain-containing protein n=1 Tax=Adhaeribacter radiodurans TaxID=2745197 RepID=A0A7L7L575_9BACT|nr:T9SS type A sorting domain-containing protein [Adhaeribacter radiodurans]QMU27539.1 T9SS type A sorting domain-containing protein [Adhaeribacter radiodurans]